MAARVTASKVVVLSESAETLDGLQAYFLGVGIPVQSARTLDAILRLPEQTTALVLFPDGFASADVIERARALRRDYPRLLLLLITAEPHRFSAALSNDSDKRSTLILPKPVFGWTIVDAIRLHAESSLDLNPV
jgi:hypothetical protein